MTPEKVALFEKCYRNWNGTSVMEGAFKELLAEVNRLQATLQKHCPHYGRQHAATRQLIRSLGCAGHYPTLKRMLEDLLADANRSSHEHAMTKAALRTVVQSVPKQ
jgi:hypothetical protein